MKQGSGNPIGRLDLVARPRPQFVGDGVYRATSRTDKVKKNPTDKDEDKDAPAEPEIRPQPPLALSRRPTPSLKGDGTSGTWSRAVGGEYRSRTTPPSNEISSGVLLAYTAYQQIAGVLGAFAILAIAGNFVHIDWCGVIGTSVAVWNDYVRPAMSFLLDITIVAVVKALFGLQMRIPEVLRDYLTMGVINYFSDLRALSWYLATGDAQDGDETSLFVVPLYRHFRIAAFDVLLWPMTMSRDIVQLVTLRSRGGGMVSFSGWYATFLSSLPLAYFAVLLTLNSSQRIC